MGKFPESAIMKAYLSGLKGIEIGAASHNPFNLDTINVDYIQHGPHTHSGREQQHLAGSVDKVDVLADACSLPFEDKSYDFVVNSHVFEHIYSPIHALNEWDRVARKYIALIIPEKDRCGEAECNETSIPECWNRYYTYDPNDPAHREDKHWTHWKVPSFLSLAAELGFHIERCDDKDDKVGNGFLVILAARPVDKPR